MVISVAIMYLLCKVSNASHNLEFVRVLHQETGFSSRGPTSGQDKDDHLILAFSFETPQCTSSFPLGFPANNSDKQILHSY